MPITTKCPSCERTLRVPDNLLGQNVKCPSCGTTFTAEDSPPASEAPTRPATPAEERVAEERRPSPRRRPADEPDDYDQDYDDRGPRRAGRYQPHRGAVILVLGICSLVVCGLLGPVAWIMGNNDLQAMAAGRMDPSGEGMTKAGKILGMIATILILVGCVIYAMIFAAMGIGGASRR